METILITVYMLICPVIVTGVLGVIVHAFMKELRTAKREGRQII